MSQQIVLIENLKDWKTSYPDVRVVLAKDYLDQSQYFKLRDAKIVNLCRSYGYLTIGYYCSLLAQARRHKVIPTVRTINDLSSKAIYSLNVEDLDETVQKGLKKSLGLDQRNAFEMDIFFGRCRQGQFPELARQIFDLFQCPLLKVEFRLQGNWHISAIKAAHLHGLTPEQEEKFIEAFEYHRSKPWHRPRAKNHKRFDLAVLYNPAERLPPSNKRALQKFVKVGEKLGISVDLIERRDYSKLAEYDALFIRETTEIEHYTYRFAKKAENEGMAVIDDPDSIVKCTNKVYLAELLAAHKVPTPKTVILQEVGTKALQKLEASIPYPMVLKIPDSSFSRGIYKVNNFSELKAICKKLFTDSDLILAQEFMYTEYDWRIGILRRQPLYACQYFMSKYHWQIVKHSASGRFTEGGFKTLPVDEVPAKVLEAALKSANLIGDGLYGVDVKMTDKGAFVIEVNDNPNIDAGVEDGTLGDGLYRLILEEFIRRIETLRSR